MLQGVGVGARAVCILLLGLLGGSPRTEALAQAPVPLLREVGECGLPAQGKTYGGTWADLDGDGALDLFLSRHGDSPEVWLCRGLRFAPPADPRIVTCPGSLGDQHGAGACDYDGDGRWDLYVTVGADRGRGEGRHRLWRQASPGLLRDAVDPDELLADPAGRGRGALWLELDGDDSPELLVLNFASPPRLFHRLGKSWEDWSTRLSLVRTYPGGAVSRTLLPWFTAAAAGDLDGDGHCDLVVAGEEFALLRGDGAGALADVTDEWGLGPQHPPLSHVALGDVDNDGDLDLLLVCRGGQLQLWLSDSQPQGPRFRLGPELTALRPLGELRAALLVDLDADGLLDLYVARQNPPRLRLGNLVARGRGDGGFDAAPQWGGCPWQTSAAHGASAIDLDRDGDLDLVLFNGDGERVFRPGAVVLYENTAPIGRGLTLDVVPRAGALHALGARVVLHAGGRAQTRQVQCVATPANGAILPLHFGVGEAPGPYRLSVDWPNGRHQELWLPAAGRAYRLRENDRSARVLPAVASGAR